MSNKKEQTPEEIQAQQELSELRQLAISLGMQVGKDFSANTGKEKLEERIAEFQEKVFQAAEAKRQEEVQEKRPLPANLPITPAANETKNQRRQRMHNEANRLIRVKVTCHNKDKSEWFGEVFTFRNSFIGTIKKFVPFGSPEPYHVPKVLVTMMKDRKYTAYRNVKDRFGNTTKKGYTTPEFSIEEFPPLTAKEHEELRKTQLIAKGQIED